MYWLVDADTDGGEREPDVYGPYATISELCQAEELERDDTTCVIIQLHMDNTITAGSLARTFEKDE